MSSFTYVLALLFAAQCALAAASGCGSSPIWSFDDTRHSNRTIGYRSFLVHLPDSYEPNTPAPVVISYHGFKGTDKKQERISGFSESGLKINNTGIIAVYPLGAYGPGKTGNDSATAWQGAPYAAPGVDDITFTKNIISELQANLCVDPNRIFAAGKSEGGGFTHMLACNNSTAPLFAAFAPVSAAVYPGLFPFEGCNPGRKVPIINFHGLADKIAPFHGRPADTAKDGPEYALPNITAWREAWATRNGCNSTKPSGLKELAVDDASNSAWDCTEQEPDAIVNTFTIKGLGHSWPTTAGLDGGAATFNATPTYIVPFFDAHPLTGAYAQNFSQNYSTGTPKGTGALAASGAERTMWSSSGAVAASLCATLWHLSSM